MGRVCDKHQEFYETQCRWCEPERAIVPAPPALTFQQAAPGRCANVLGWYSNYSGPVQYWHHEGTVFAYGSNTTPFASWLATAALSGWHSF